MATSVAVSDLVEVLADADATTQLEKYWYGEVVEVNGDSLTINYITKHSEDVWRYDDTSYITSADSVNHVEGTHRGKKVEEAWKKMGFVYRGDHEIIFGEDVDSAEEDEDWEPDGSGEEDNDDSESEGEDDVSDDDVITDDEDAYSVANSEEHADEVTSDEDEEETPPKKQKKRDLKAAKE